MGATISKSESERLDFSGRDSTECEQFITTVKKYAYYQGKQRDDKWIADFVGTRLRQDALRWWAGLDEATQGSWKLLQNALIARYGPVFHGDSGEEAEKFVFAVRQRARDAGKLGDPQWIATYAAPLFAGGALRWYVSLEQSAQQDWDALQRAIFFQYPKESSLSLASSITPLSPSATVTEPSFKPWSRRGYIKLVRSGDPEIYYLSRNWHPSGFLLVEASSDNALEVEYREQDDLSEPRVLLIPDGQIDNYNVLGIKLNKSDSTSSTSAGLCPIDSSSGLGSWNDNSGGLLVTNAWKILSKLGGDITLSAMNGSATFYASPPGTGSGVVFYKEAPSIPATSIIFEAI